MMLQYPSGGEKLVPIFVRLQGWGLMDLILPFLLMFALTFAILQKVKIFQRPKIVNGQPSPTEKVSDRKLNGIISAVLSLMIIVPHVMGMFPAQLDPVLLVAKILPSSMILLVAMLLSLLLVGLATKDDKILPFGFLASLIAAAIFAIVLIITIFPTLPFAHYFYDQNIQAIGIVVLILLLVVWFVTRESGSGRPLTTTVEHWFGGPPTPPRGG